MMFKFLKSKRSGIHKINHKTVLTLTDEYIDSLIVGEFSNNAVKPNSFNVYPDFFKQFNQVLSIQAMELDSLQHAAEHQPNGHVYLIDHRTKDGIMGKVPSRDIIGAYPVNDGILKPNSYVPNVNYEFYSRDGKIQLPKEILELMIVNL